MSSTTNQTLFTLAEEPVKASWSALPLELKEKIIDAFLDNVLDKLEFGWSEHLHTKPFQNLGAMKPKHIVSHYCATCMIATETYFEKHFARNVAALIRSSPSSMMDLITQVAGRMLKERVKLIDRMRQRFPGVTHWSCKVHFEESLLLNLAFEFNLRRMLLKTPEDDQTEIVKSVCEDI